MTLEEKARAYDKAIEKAKYALMTDMDDSGHWAVNYIFPELKEDNNDEKINKSLISFLKSPFVHENITDEKVAPWIDWLEKQAEQNSAEDVKPKV